MKTIAQLPEVMQRLFTQRADEVARETGFIRRVRKLTGSGFVQALVFGWLQNARATRRELQEALLCSGVQMSGPGLDARFTPAAVAFLRAMVEEASSHAFSAEVEMPVVARFNGVYLTDGSRLEHPVYGVKVVARLELQRGALQLGLQALNRHDRVSRVMDLPLPAGALHVADLGFFDLAWFKKCLEGGVQIVTRLKANIGVYSASGQPLDVAQLLSKSAQTVSLPVRIGAGHLPMILLAQRVSEETYQQRCRQLHHRARRKAHPVSPERLKLCRWTIYLTSCADLTFAQVHTLYRARWQIERLFRRWKSLATLSHSTSHDPVRQACECYAKLLAVLLAHWLTQACAWTNAPLSLDKLFLSLQRLAPLLHRACVHSPDLLHWFRLHFQYTASAHALSRRRRNPNTYDLLRNFDLLA